MRRLMATLVLLAVALPLHAGADLVWPRTEGEMLHVMVALDRDMKMVHVHTDSLPEPPPLRNFGEQHFPPADVLDAKGYNDQYGWLADGFISLNPDEALWVELVDQTPGLETYEGGMRSMKQTHTYSPLFTTAGSSPRWRWTGTMVHNWYAASQFGEYDATYRVYLGDLSGTPLGDYMDDTVTLHWSYVPEPATALLFGAALLLRPRR